MGCFNSSGFISKLPILGGDKVVCFIALENEDGISGHSLYYPDSVVAPYFLPVRGEYNEYGSLYNVVKSPIVDFIEKRCECSIENVLNAVERCLYGETLGDNIEYWSKDSNDNEDLVGYNKLLKLFHNDKNVRPILLLEHEDVYDNLTDRYFENTSGWSSVQPEDKVKLFFSAIDEYKAFYEKYKEKFDSSQSLLYAITDDLPKLADGGISDMFSSFHLGFDTEKEISDEGCALHDKYRNKHCTFLIYSELSRSIGFTDRMTLQELFEMYDKCQDEIIRVHRLYTIYSLSPMYFCFSKTAGEQNYNMDCLCRLMSVCKDKADSMYKDYVEEYSRDEDDEDK